MSFWHYLKGKLHGLGYLLLGVVAMVAGAGLITAFGLGHNVFQPSLESAGCAAGVLIILLGGLVLAYGQQKLQKMDE